MSVSRYATQRYVPISNLPNGEQANAARFDTNGDGVLQPDEQRAYYSDKTGGGSPVSLDDIYRVAGGRQRDDRPLHGYYDGITGRQLGNFTIPGFGAGHIVAGRRTGGYDYVGYDDPNRVEGGQAVFNIVLNCDLVDQVKIERDVREARMIIAREGFRSEGGSHFQEKVVMPLDVRTIDSQQVWNRTLNRMVDSAPEKYLALSLDMETAWSLAGGRGLSFFVEIEMTDGTVHHVNKDNVPGRDFLLERDWLKDT